MKGYVQLFSFIVIASILMSCARTPATYRRTDSGITSLEEIVVNGDNQHLLLRGRDADQPVLLLLHGGPGMPMMYLAHKFQRELEQHFVVVHWDQRSSGKSWSKEVDTATINIRQYIDDAFYVVEHLRSRFGQGKVLLAGHSFGSYLGTLMIKERPELFHAYVGIGQVVDDKKALEIQKDFLYSEANERLDRKAISELDNYGHRIYEKYLFKYGGELKHHKSFWPFIWAGLGSPEYVFKDFSNLSKASNFCSRHMQYNVIQSSLMEEPVSTFEIPVYYFTGKQDYTTPFELIETYFRRVNAPHKELIWFEESAHFPFYEEPDLFTKQMLRMKKQLFE